MTDTSGTTTASGDARRYDYAIDPHGDSTANKVLNLVGENKRVLELGCGPGAMTRYLKDRLGCRVSAIEFDAAAGERARAYCERLLIADLDTLDLADAFAGERFDVIIAADVLEHLRDPWRVLRAARELLAADGCLVVSIPNVAHNVVIAQLIAGRFPYVDKGLLDRTHLRFFTRHDVEDLLLSCGFLPARWLRSVVREQDTEFAQAWLQTPAAVREALSESADGRTYQFIVQAFVGSDTGWIEKTRAETADRDALQKQLAAVSDELDEHRRAFAEAQRIIADKEKALSDYAEAFHQARDQLEQRRGELHQLNLAFAEARERLEQLGEEKKRLENSVPLALARRLKKLIGRG